ncbi:MAG: P-loop NTPase [Phycisphaerales bacterium]
MRESRVTISEDQASRLRAMVEAMQRRPAAPAAGAAVRQHAPRPASPIAPAPAPPIAKRSARVVSIASGKGGVGKTSAAVNLAICLVQMRQRVTLLDADLGMANADVLCGLTPTRRLEQFVGVADAPAASAPSAPPARRSITEIAMDAPGGFRLIPGSVGVSRMAELSGDERDRLMASLAELDQSTDVIVVDTGAGLGREVIGFSRAADLAIVIATPEPTSIADAYALIKCILHGDRGKARPLRPPSPDGGLPRVVLVVNQASDQREAAAVHARMAAVCQRFLGYTLPLLGWIMHDARVPASVRSRRPLLLSAPGSPAAGAVRALAGAVARELRLESGAPAPARGGGSGGLSGLLSRVLRGG